MERSFVWREIVWKSNFPMIINADYIELQRFLKDISSVVLERVQDTIERHNCIKVNTIFNGEFATSDKRVNKSINIENYKLFQTSNLREWYERHIIKTTYLLRNFENVTVDGHCRELWILINNKCNSMRVGRFKVPREIMTKRAMINVRSTMHGSRALRQ